MTLRIDISDERERVVLTLTGRIQADQIAELQRLLERQVPDQKLTSTGKRHLYLVRSKMRTLPHRCHRHTEMRMVTIVDRGGVQNIGTV